MSVIKNIIALSRQIAYAILKNEKPKDLLESDLFNDEDKDYILREVTDEIQKKRRKKLKQSINVKNDWKLVRQKIDKPVYKFQYWKYAIAAAVAIILISLPFVIQESKTKILPAITKIEEPVVPGEDKAILTLDDGNQIVLEKGKEYSNININSNGENIVYQKAKTSKKEPLVYNYLTIPRGGQFFVELSDGTKVWLNSESRLKYPVTFRKNETRQVELVYGEAYFEASHHTHHDGTKFTVITKNQKVEVLGTEFNVKAYSDDKNIYTTLITGKVNVSNGSTLSKNIIPGEQSIINIENQSLQITKVDTALETAWKKGLFIFNKQSLENMMKVLSRWYNIEVVYNNNEKKNLKFSGILKRSDTINELLNTIEKTGDVKFKITKEIISIE